MENFVTYLVMALFVSGVGNLVLWQKYNAARKAVSLRDAARSRRSRTQSVGDEFEEGG